MKIVRVRPGGWSHRSFVYPETRKEEFTLRLRGYRPLRRSCLLGRIGWWVHPKYEYPNL